MRDRGRRRHGEQRERGKDENGAEPTHVPSRSTEATLPTARAANTPAVHPPVTTATSAVPLGGRHSLRVPQVRPAQGCEGGGVHAPRWQAPRHTRSVATLEETAPPTVPAAPEGPARPPLELLVFVVGSSTLGVVRLALRAAGDFRGVQQGSFTRPDKRISMVPRRPGRELAARPRRAPGRREAGGRADPCGRAAHCARL